MSFKKLLSKLNRRNTKLLPNFSKASKIFYVCLAIIVTILVTKSVFAQSSNLLKQKQDAINKGNNQEAWMNEALGSNLVSMQIMMAGTIPDAILNGETTPQGYPNTSFIPGGILGNTNQMVAATFNSPASGVEYIAQVKDNFLGKPAYAQGVGFNGLNPILPLWKIFRNLVYLLSTVFFIAVGIMIMLRVKVSPQAVVTIQSAIPQIITTLILVTFSYAIAGLCIDLINFFLAFSLALLFHGAGKDFANNLFGLSWTDWSISNLINFIRGLLGENAFNYSNLSTAGFYTMFSMLNRMAPAVAVSALGGTVGGVIGTFVGGLGGLLIGLGIGAIGLLLVIEIILVINIIKFLFGLMKCYLTIILRIIFAPLEIALGALPNSKMGFNNWIKEIIGNMIVFPASLLFLVIINMIIDFAGGSLWAPSLLTGVGGFFLPTIIGIAGILILSKLPNLIPEVIFSIKPSPFGKAVGEGFKPFGTAAKFGATAVGDRAASHVEGAYQRASSTGTATRAQGWANSAASAARHLGFIPKKK
jgi:hypothetical protein